MTEEEKLKRYLSDMEKGKWNEMLEEAKFLKELISSVNLIASPSIRSYIHKVIQPELNRLKDEQNRLKITAQVRYDEHMKREDRYKWH